MFGSPLHHRFSPRLGQVSGCLSSFLAKPKAALPCLLVVLSRLRETIGLLALENIVVFSREPPAALAAQWEAPAVAFRDVPCCMLGGGGLHKGCLMPLVWRVG